MEYNWFQCIDVHILYLLTMFSLPSILHLNSSSILNFIEILQATQLERLPINCESNLNDNQLEVYKKFNK